MDHPTARVLALLELLQAQPGLSGTELASRLNIDPRTLRRYISTLEGIGIPILAERGRNGGYSLIPGFKLPPLVFTDDEALALALGLLAARRIGVAEAAAASAAAKLERVMPESLKQRMRAISETVVLDLADSSLCRANESLATFSSASLTLHRIRLRYRAANGTESERDVAPYGVALHDGHWYAVGHCYLRDEIRTFRLDRVLTTTKTALPFSRPARFDVLDHLRKAVGTLPRAFEVEVLLKTELDSARGHLRDAIGVLEQTPEGIVLYNQSDDLGWLARQLASLPFEFVVRKPFRLHEEITALARRLTNSAAGSFDH